MQNSNPILKAVLSKLQAEKDEALVQLELILNKNQSDTGVTGIVNQATELFKKIADIENTLELVKYVTDSNPNAQLNQQIAQLTELISKTQTQNNNNNTEENGSNP